MPTAKLYTMESESGEPKLFASFTYKIDDSFADARQKLELLKYVDYEWDFLDATIGIRMMEVSERGNLIDEYSSKVVIMPRLPGMCGPRTTHVVDSRAGHPIVLSSGASNGISLPSTDSETIERSGGMSLNSDQWDINDLPDQWDVNDLPEGNANQTPIVIVSNTIEDPQVSFLATSMPPELQKAWYAQIEKLKEHMKLLKAKNQKWKVQTYDKDGQPRGKIVCDECEHTFDCASSKGIMDRVSIANCFTNFKQKHLHCHKHIANLAKNRNEKIDKSEVKKRVEAAGLSNRAILELHIAIVERVNTCQSLSKTTFEIVGDVNKDPVDLKIFHLYCTFCGEHLIMIPKQRNLESNLESHCASIPHLNAVARSERPASGLPVLSRKPGRPRAGDKRDRSQKSIAGFFSPPEAGRSQSGRDSGASTSNKGKGTIDPISLLCWGLWRDSVKWGQETRPIKQLLTDQLKVSGEWYSEPLVKANVWNFDTQSICAIEGVFRHIKCTRVTQKGGGFQDLTCEHCATIKLKEDFRLRVLREERASEKRGTRDTGSGRRLGYLTVPEILRQAQTYRGRLWRERKLNKSLQHRLCMMKLKSPRIGELCQEASNSKEILKFCQNIILAHKRDAFGGRQALWDMLRDIASNLNRSKEGHRFRQGTKLLMQTLFLHGGRRVIDCLATNAISPSLNTLQRDRRGMAVFRAGICEDQFKFIAKVYAVLKTRAGISGPIPVYLAEDETSVKRTVRWQPKQDTLLGFCGATENHLCMSGLEITVGDDKAGFTNITSAFESYVVGHQARCVMVNPLVEGFPRLCLMATGTCNRFDASWVRRQWDTLDSMWTTYCLEAVGPVLGHASDGDSRRRKLMLEDYSGNSSSGQKVNLGWDGWQLTHSMTKEGPVRHAFGLHDQDFIHNHKKLVNPLDSCARHLKLGAYSVTICHLALSYTLYEKADHGMNHEDVMRTDRQNWASAQRLCSRKVGRTLGMLRERKDAKRERTLGTEIYLSICADYMDIFLNTQLTLRDRIELCGKVGFFFRLWRLWCFHGNHSVGGNQQTINFGSSCIPMQTFLDIQISVHMVVLLIIQFRDNFSNLPVPLQLTGSDSCEQFFSKVGGMRGHERSYDFAELVECATSLNRLVAMDLTEGIVGAGKSHKKHSNIWMKLHPRDGEGGKDADLTDYTGLESNANVVSALVEGLKLAQNAATRLEMNPSTSSKNKLWWEAPWKVEAKGVREGGWCDINVDDLDPLDALDPEESSVDAQCVCSETQTPSNEPFAGPSLHSSDPGDDGVSDVQVAEGGARAAFSQMYADLVYGENACEDVKPTVSFNGRKMYKSTLVSQLVENPKLSKDRLTKVKQSLYFNSLVDKRKNREGMPSMLMSIGSDIGVYFEEDVPMGKQTRGAQSIAKALKGEKRKKAAKEPVAKRRRGEPVSVEATTSGNTKYNWWIGRVQCIQRKYGASVGRSREPVDLLDRPGDEVECEVRCNWLQPIGARKQKFKYDVSDPQLISLNSIISIVNITVNPEKPDVFLLHPDDVAALDTFVKNRPELE